MGRIACTWSKGQSTGTERVGAGRPAPFRPPGSPPPLMFRHHCRELHHLQGYASDLRCGTFATVEGRLASPWPAGLASARRYKIRRWRHPSTHHMLRFAHSSLITSISSPFLEFLCLIKFFELIKWRTQVVAQPKTNKFCSA